MLRNAKSLGIINLQSNVYPPASDTQTNTPKGYTWILALLTSVVAHPFLPKVQSEATLIDKD